MIKSRLIQSNDYYRFQDMLDNFFEGYPNIKILNLEYRTTPTTILSYGSKQENKINYSVLIIFDDMSVTTKDDYE